MPAIFGQNTDTNKSKMYPLINILYFQRFKRLSLRPERGLSVGGTWTPTSQVQKLESSTWVSCGPWHLRHSWRPHPAQQTPLGTHWPVWLDTAQSGPKAQLGRTIAPMFCPIHKEKWDIRKLSKLFHDLYHLQRLKKIQCSPKFY